MIDGGIKKILVIRLSALGDTIHTLPGVYVLREKFPNAQIDWVVEDKASKFVENNPLIDKIYVIKRKERSFKSFFTLIRQIRAENYDVALDFQQLLKSGIILGFSGAKRRITLDGGREFSSFFANEIIKTGRKLFDLNYHVVKRNLDLVCVLGCNTDKIKFVLPDLSQEYSQFIKDTVKCFDKTKKTIVLAPATTWENKHWTIDGWRDLITEFKDKCNIVITASINEQELIKKIIDGFDNIIDISGKTNLSDLVYLYRYADIVVSPDSGSAHTAWASGAKSILTLFFSTCAKRTAPFGEHYYSVSAKTNCAPCMKKVCKLKNDKNKCINSINSYEVIELMQKILFTH